MSRSRVKSSRVEDEEKVVVFASSAGSSGGWKDEAVKCWFGDSVSKDKERS